jgi:hypothetical protein
MELDARTDVRSDSVSSAVPGVVLETTATRAITVFKDLI